MSDLSRQILESALSPSDIQCRRSDNFRFLADALGEWGLIRSLPREIAPIGYPIVTDHRDSLRKALCEYEIFAPVHWPTPKAVPEEFHHCRRLAARVLTLPCDQRLDTSDLERIVEVVKRCLH
jgi:dTDP-4-amino-4,6-dideoxygalactose transaminase